MTSSPLVYSLARINHLPFPDSRQLSLVVMQVDAGERQPAESSLTAQKRSSMPARYSILADHSPVLR